MRGNNRHGDIHVQRFGRAEPLEDEPNDPDDVSGPLVPARLSNQR